MADEDRFKSHVMTPELLETALVPLPLLHLPPGLFSAPLDQNYLLNTPFRPRSISPIPQTPYPSRHVQLKL